jgi:hypothetical protein
VWDHQHTCPIIIPTYLATEGMAYRDPVIVQLPQPRCCVALDLAQMLSIKLSWHIPVNVAPAHVMTILPLCLTAVQCNQARWYPGLHHGS